MLPIMPKKISAIEQSVLNKKVKSVLHSHRHASVIAFRDGYIFLSFPVFPVFPPFSLRPYTVLALVCCI